MKKTYQKKNKKLQIIL